MEPAVSVRGLGKRYRILHQQANYGRLSESITGLIRAPIDRVRHRQSEAREAFWALKDIDFDVEAGEVMGVVGRNGAGKSTLLKVLSRVTEPTTGIAELNGRVASLLEVGTGFHPELTGRENIFLSGSILGMRREETARKFDEIVDFAEVEQFLDTPVKRFSSGMAVRLGFAVAAHLEAEILIVDEVLAVGDAAFQKKCLSKMADVSRLGRTILFVSHNMAAVEALCTRGVLLEAGSVALSGTAAEVVQRYVDQSVDLSGVEVGLRTDRQGDGRVRVTSLQTSAQTGSTSEVRIGFETSGTVRNVDFSLAIFTLRGDGVANLWTASAGDTFTTLPKSGIAVCDLPKTALMPGSYRVNVFCTVNGEVADWVQDAAMIDVLPGDFFGTGKLPPAGYGSVLVANVWRLDSVQSPPAPHA